jgi:hypothetical protein
MAGLRARESRRTEQWRAGEHTLESREQGREEEQRAESKGEERRCSTVEGFREKELVPIGRKWYETEFEMAPFNNNF